MFLHASSFLAALPLGGVACWALLAGVRLGLLINDGSMTFPGPGLWPALAGSGLLLCAAGLCLPSPRSTQRPVQPSLLPPSRNERDRRALRASLTGLALACLAWICLTPLLGWLAATVATLYLAARAAGNRRKTSALMAVIFPMLLHLAIVRSLGWPLPEGLFRSLL